MKFELTGYNIDNLLKTLHRKKIQLYNINRTNHNQISFEVNEHHVKKVKRYVANFKVKQTPGHFKRLPKFLWANLGAILGLTIGTIFGIWASNYTWQIKIYGTKDLQPNEIIQVLKQNNVSIGKINRQTSEEIEAILLNNYNKLAQVSVIKQGTAIIIDLSEKLVYNEQVFKPITAKYSGIITKINLITGTTNIKVGDYVNVGDSLILPFNLDSSGNKISVQPKADIYATIFVVGKCQLSQNETILVKTGKTKKVYSYHLFKFNLFKGKNKNSFALFKVVSYNENISKLLPFKRRVDVYHELTTKQITHNLEEEKGSLLKQSEQQAEQTLPEVYEEISRTKETTIQNGTLFATTIITIKGQIND